MNTNCNSIQWFNKYTELENILKNRKKEPMMTNAYKTILDYLMLPGNAEQMCDKLKFIKLFIELFKVNEKGGAIIKESNRTQYKPIIKQLASIIKQKKDRNSLTGYDEEQIIYMFNNYFNELYDMIKDKKKAKKNNGINETKYNGFINEIENRKNKSILIPTYGNYVPPQEIEAEYNKQSVNIPVNTASKVRGGSSQFINIPGVGKRKVRYQKNGRAYVIVKKRN